MLANEELDGEIASVERAGKGADAGFVDLKAEDFQHGQLDAVGAHRPVLFDMGDQERLWQSRRHRPFGAIFSQSLRNSSDQGFHGILLRRFNAAAQG